VVIAVNSNVRGRRNRTIPLNPFAGTNLWQLLESRAARSTEAPFLIWHPFDGKNRVWSYGTFAQEASSVAVGLTRRGIKPGDTVLIHLENCPEFLVTWFACAAIGAVAVTTNTRSAPDELSYFVHHSNAVGAITQPRFADVVSNVGTDLRWVVAVDHDAGVPADVGYRASPADSFASLHGDADELAVAPIDPFSPLSVQYTSGTTSRPKGVLWTQANGLWGARTNALHANLQPEDCQLVYMPLFHTNALAWSMLATLWAGARLVLVPKWSTSRFWDISLQYHCTWLSLIGSTLRAIRNMDPPQNCPYHTVGAAICDVPIHRTLSSVKTLGWYGMTETISHPIVGDVFLPNRAFSMGRPAPEYGVAVVRDDGSPVVPDETGQLLIKGVPGISLFSEYLHDREATSKAFDESGWFRTGDLVTPHSDGHITFADRSKDLLKVGGENVAASEIERVIGDIPGVSEVAVVGRSDPHLDEVPVGFVVPREADLDLQDVIIDRCRNMLADFKVPREVYVIAELPRSTLRKVNKGELRSFADPEADRIAAEQRWILEGQIDPSGEADDEWLK
jgi:crotonobetaine/carnitine-CoA ligase